MTVRLSRVANGRVANVEDVLSMGDIVKVQVLEVDPKTGKISLDRLDKPDAPESSKPARDDAKRPGQGTRKPRRSHHS